MKILKKIQSMLHINFAFLRGKPRGSFAFLRGKRFAFYAILISAVFFFGAAGFYFGYQNGIENPKTIIIQNVSNTEKDEAVETDFGIFWEAWDLLKQEHLKGKEAVDRNLVYGAISGLVDSLNDPNTVFFPPEDSKKFEEDVTGNFGGIGAEIGVKNNQLVVIAPLKDTPADKAGLRAGDKILAIDGKGTDGIDVSEAVKKIRGEIGKEVALLISREDWSQPKEIKIIRANIEIPTLEWNYIDKNSAKTISKQEVKDIIEKGDKKIAYLKLFSFNQNAPLAFYKSALRILFANLDGIILDLRNNPGGFLEVANNLAGWFLDKGEVIVKEKFKDDKELAFRANGNGALKSIPTVILVNKGSASASEILAGALRASLKTKLIGTTTFGKGTVQELRALSDGSKIKLTTANWVLSDGTIINDHGLEPDIKIDLTEKDIEQKLDPQLEKAIEVLLEEIKTKK